MEVASAVSSLIKAGVVISGIISAFLEAPSLLRNVLDQNTAVSMIFSQIDDLISDTTAENTDKKSRIFVQQIVVVLSGCVCAFTELERAIDGLKNSDVSIWDRGKWVLRESDLRRMLCDLQNHKLSINCMLSIYACYVYGYSKVQELER